MHVRWWDTHMDKILSPHTDTIKLHCIYVLFPTAELHPAFAGSRPGLQSLACCWDTLWSVTAQKMKGQLDSEWWSTIPAFWLLLIPYPWLKFPLSKQYTSLWQVTCLGLLHLGLQCNLLISATLFIFDESRENTHTRKKKVSVKQGETCPYFPIINTLSPFVSPTPSHEYQEKQGERSQGIWKQTSSVQLLASRDLSSVASVPWLGQAAVVILLSLNKCRDVHRSRWLYRGAVNQALLDKDAQPEFSF